MLNCSAATHRRLGCRRTFTPPNQGSIDATTFKLIERKNSIGYLRSNTIEIGSRVETQLHKINADSLEN
ncbi:hypothetical protein Q3G72_003098 [Acer saccharum]|nr:hypothetical protein Q3G72_003098 [Acer saccharum]